MKSSSITRPILLITIALLSGCSKTTLLTKQDYQKSQQQFIQGNTDDAALNFPRRAENGDFITTVEKAYLSLLQGKPQVQSLLQQVNVLENRVRYHVSREAKTFFYLQTPEDYYASEHEIIWLHLLLSWSYSLQREYESACVEARVASSLLSLPWSPAGHFDDPSLRIFLAGLWAMCGNWQDAQVDFRAAWVLDNRLSWAKDIADLDHAPSNLFIVLGGPGPEPVWMSELKLNPLRSSRQVGFKLRGLKSSLTLKDRRGLTINVQRSPDANKWYERHLERESELHEIILDSTFGGKTVASGALASSKITAKAGIGLLVGIGSTALGAVLVNAGIQSGSNELIRYGLITATAGITWGSNYAVEGYRSSIREFKQNVDPSINYRFVRYLPEYLWVGWSDQTITYPVEIISNAGSKIVIKKPDVFGASSVAITFIADASKTFSFTR
jgi:hypothetical protein